MLPPEGEAAQSADRGMSFSKHPFSQPQGLTAPPEGRAKKEKDLDKHI